VRLKASHAVQELLARGIGNTPASALRLVIGKLGGSFFSSLNTVAVRKRLNILILFFFFFFFF